MKTLCWNVWGLRSPWAFREVSNEIRKINPSLCFLSETKCKAAYLNKLKNHLNYHGCICVDSVGVKGRSGAALERGCFCCCLILFYSPYRC